MGATNSEESKTSYFKLKAKTSDTDSTPFFGKNTKVGSEWQITERFDTFNGHLIDIEHSTYQYEGETKNKLVLKLKDEDGTLNIVEAGLNSLTQSLINCLANCVPENISMQVTLGKAKIIEGKEGKRYPNIWIKNNGQDIKWKYQISDQPKATEVMVGAKKVKDDTVVVAFWLKVLNEEVKPKFKNVIVNSPEVNQKTEPTDDLPF